MTLPIARELAQFGISCAGDRTGAGHGRPLRPIMPQERRNSLARDYHFRRLGHDDEFASLVLHMIDNPI